MTIRWLPSAPRNPNVKPETMALYVGTAASIRLHKSAVKRNRMRRRCREALRIHVKDMNKVSTMQLLITPKIASLTCDYSEIRRDIASFLSSAL